MTSELRTKKGESSLARTSRARARGPAVQCRCTNRWDSDEAGEGGRVDETARQLLNQRSQTKLKSRTSS